MSKGTDLKTGEKQKVTKLLNEECPVWRNKISFAEIIE